MQDREAQRATMSLREKVEAARVRAWTKARANLPTLSETGLAVLSALLLVVSFPDFNLWPLAWIALAPLFVAVARQPQTGRSFLLGWLTGTLYFYGSCYWLTYSPIRYGGIPAPVAYFLLLPVTLIVGLFPALCCAALARMIRQWGTHALFVAPFLWTACEWARLGATGQLWNAVGYSQAYQPFLIQAAHWGGVYAVGFLIVTVNAAVAYAFLQRNITALMIIGLVICGTLGVALYADFISNPIQTDTKIAKSMDAIIIGVQPNVPMEPTRSIAEAAALINRHVLLTETALHKWDDEVRQNDEPLQKDKAQHGTTGELDAYMLGTVPRVVVWPESPMNFTFSNDAQFRAFVADFAKRNHTSVLFNSLEPAPANGAYNAAVMVNEEGRLVAQYDKIRLLPFGEYIPLPRWLPGVNMIPVMVGDFTPGAEYPLMPLGNDVRAGVFICFESAFPGIARQLVLNGADVLINISNDGYLGPTPILHQHLANAVFRAVENARPVLRVTNTGITARITERGEVLDATKSFQPDARTWTVNRNDGEQTFYTRHGDVFAGFCALVSLFFLIAASRRKRIL
ncbi:MAG: apolipoprotein N-acyltransferase [Pyrinomonadaceae bacterium]